ncbi:uncharacterized protein LOC111326000 [Stylophora pistillata]|nr:uncharacterized protein LOC111326000 [Stylophora pistillata]XP_022785651.1 uncharacterized protein LOC111326000 [Stylophora pistillata]
MKWRYTPGNRTMATSKHLSFLMFCVVLVSVAIVMRYSVPWGVAILTIAISWFCYDHCHVARISSVEFYKLHTVPQYTNAATALVTSEWSVPVTAEGIEEPNYVRTSSMIESRDTFPCHLVALATFGGVKQVIAHCVLRETSASRSPDLNKFLRMLRMRLPLPAVQQSMEVAGLDSSVLSAKDISESEIVETPTSSIVHNVTLSSLVVKPEFRGQGLGKSMCAYALQVASGLGAIEIIGGCKNKLVAFYEKIGVKRRVGLKRKNIPRVRLGNEMFLVIDKEARKQASEILAMTNAKCF